MSYKVLHRITGLFVFLAASIVYFMTVQPSVSFWDCGEFIASSYLLQVPHPPGTPFFLILGRLFSMIPFADNIAFRVNTVSVLSSAFTVLFLYLIAVKLIENYKKGKAADLFDSFMTFMAAAVGALSLAFADTFWFNAVEAEVYALSTFFIAFVTWIIIVWNEKADEPDNEKYLIMIAYLLGLSVGVHLMAVLAMVPIVMIIMFRKYITDEAMLKKSANLFLIHTLVVLAIAFALWYTQDGNSPPTPDVYKSFDMKFLVIVGLASVAIMAAFRKLVFGVNSFYMPLMIGGVALLATYPGIVKWVPNLVTTIGADNLMMDIFILVLLFAGMIYAMVWTGKKNKQTSNLIAKAFLFAFLGFTTYSLIIIRANQEPPINLNSPKTFPEVVSYLNRDQYGDFPTFKRRFSQEPHQMGIYREYSSDLDFLVDYQMNHMFHRYLLWNYVGRESTVQDTGVDYTKYLMIPFLLGLFGLFWHFNKDWRMASVFLVAFVFLGYLTAFYQNQQQPQPRERDYFYVGAFFVYSIWIALGVRGIADVISQSFKGKSFLKPVLAVVIIAFFFLVPFNMLRANYFEHNRSDNYVPWDYSYNLLQSVKPNAILFTNGDNDTFPLWYLQDVEGVRRDVRIANLSLLNTGWYIKQLKNNTPHGAAKVPMTMTDVEIDNLTPVRWDGRNMSLPVGNISKERYGIADTTQLPEAVNWFMPPSLQFSGVKAVRVQDLVVLDILQANNWERPVYFAVTVSEDSKIGLDSYNIMEGLATLVTPEQQPGDYPAVNEKILREQCFDEPDGFSKDYDPGFKFRGLDTQTIFFDDNHRRLTQNYRNSFMRLALHYRYVSNSKEKLIETLDEMEEKLPREVIDIDYRILYDVANLYLWAGDMDKYRQLSADVEESAMNVVMARPTDMSGGRYNPYFILQEIYETRGEYNKLVQLLERLQQIAPNDPNLNAAVERYRRLAAQQDTQEVKPNN